MGKIINPVCRALFDSDLIATRITLALAEIMWAIMLWWPGDTFGRPTYKLMANVMPEDAWGIVFMASGLTQLTIAVCQHFHTTFARYFAGWNAVLWCYVVASMLMSVYPPPAAIAGEMSLAMAAAWIWVRPLILIELFHRATQR